MIHLEYNNHNAFSVCLDLHLSFSGKFLGFLKARRDTAGERDRWTSSDGQ